ncbi:MAG TPA: sodium:proton antiporter NhaD, partial [Bacteroidia bacterium]
FKIITNRIKTKNAKKLLWIVSIITFFLSAILDNLTTAIVMVSLLRKLVHDKEQRLYFVGMVVIAANAGGAWSPIGDVTTTMLWNNNMISSMNIIKTLFIPSLVCLVIPVFLMSFKLKGEVKRDSYDYDKAEKEEKVKGSLVMLIAGVSALIFVPIFKSITHLPPYVGMLFGLSVVWVISELLHIDKTEEEKKPYSAIHALTKIDVSSVLFFLGILLAIGTLSGTGVLRNLAIWMDQTIGNKDVISVSIGLLSAVVDNVPIVAATMKMYPLSEFPIDSKIWEFIAYAAGTGGSCLIIGSAAGVAVMGMEKIDFIWYLKKISWMALLGYLAGAVAYLLVYPIFAVH